MADRELHVAMSGDDSNPGTEKKPLRTIGRAAELAEPGTTCRVHGGRYRETVRIEGSGNNEHPIRFVAEPGESVVLDGTDHLEGSWELHEGRIYRIRCDVPVEQLFVDGRMMLEARWPSISFSELLSRDGWRPTGEGSRYGRIVDPGITERGIDWTGAVVVLNVAHQFYSWSRRVESCDTERGVITYPKDLPGITHFADKTTPWEHNRYYLCGKLEALDSPGEWFYDGEERMLYLWTIDGDDPGNHEVSVKRRTYGFTGTGLSRVEVTGFEFFGCTVRFEECDHLLVDRCRFLFPTYVREISDPSGDARDEPATFVSGERNIVRSSSIAFSAVGGLEMLGSHNLVENNLIHSVCWNGSLKYNAIKCGARPGLREKEPGHTVVRRNTAFNTGNSIVSTCDMPHYLVELNHLFDGGLACKDVSLLYTHLPLIEPCTFRYNWVHDCHSEHIAIGIRGDDQTRGLTVHHNVVWGCDWFGIIVKGDRDRVHNNTVLDSGMFDILMRRRGEPEKPWRRQWPLLAAQHEHSECHNNVARVISSTHEAVEPLNCPNERNYTGDAPRLVDPEHHDFRPSAGSPLIDAGRVIETITDGYAGAAPDIGAYEYEGERWVPGVDWSDSEVEKCLYRELVW